MGKIVSRMRQVLAVRPHDTRILRASAPMRSRAIRGSSGTMSLMAQNILRGVLVGLLVLTPALLLPDISHEVAQGITLLSLLAAIVVFAEYSAAYPGLVEFRDAKPYNRIRLAFLAMVVISVALLQRDLLLTPGSDGPIFGFAHRLGEVMDFPFSPVRLLVMSLPVGLPVEHLAAVRAAAALAYLLAVASLMIFLLTLALGYWPRRNVPFNVWVNLPNFDPTKGVDVVQRLERDAHVNILLGIILPFSLPVLLHLSNLLVQPMTLQSPLAFVWGVSLWACIPVNLILRGVAMYRVAQLVRAQRQRIAAEDESIAAQPRSAYS